MDIEQKVITPTLEVPTKAEPKSNKAEDKKTYRLQIKDIKLAALISVILIGLVAVLGIVKHKEGLSSPPRSSYVSQEDSWIYYAFNRYDGKPENKNIGVYKLQLNGSKMGEKTKLYEDYGECITVKEDWIYYNSLNDGFRVYKMRIDGSSRQRLSEVEGRDLTVSGDYLFYRSSSSKNVLYRVRLSDNSTTSISEDVLVFCISGNTIYYNSASSFGKLFKMDFEGRNIKEICSIEGPVLYSNNNYIYFYDTVLKYKGLSSIPKYNLHEDAGKVYKMNIDGSNKKIIIPNKVSKLAIDGKYLYYEREVQGESQLQRVDIQGRSPEKLISNVSFISAFDGWLYYINKSDGALYRMNSEGRLTQKLEG